MMHRRFKVKISAGGAVLLAALYFLLDTDELAALLLAAVTHELGHLAAIRLTGGRVRSLTANITGAVIERDAQAGSLSELVCALSGPAAGLIWAALAAGMGSFLGLDMLLLSAGMSLVLSGFNLLPALPLDGGRALSCLLTLAGREDWAQPVVGLLSVGLSMGLTMGALLLWRVGEGNLTLLLVALWLSAIPLRKKKKK